MNKRRDGKRVSIFKTRCCHNAFHKECMKKHKEQCCVSPATGAIRPRACPLCRSVTPTGLTPSTRPHARAAPASSGGFVSGWALHSEMVRRASAARAAVQRSLMRSSAQTTRQTQAQTQPLTASPSGEAQHSSVEQQAMAPLQQRPAPAQQQPSHPSGPHNFFSPGAAYSSIAPPPRHGQQLQSRFEVAREQEQQQESDAQGGDQDGMTVELS